jgi:hypothetical protein
MRGTVDALVRQGFDWEEEEGEEGRVVHDALWQWHPASVPLENDGLYEVTVEETEESRYRQTT